MRQVKKHQSIFPCQINMLHTCELWSNWYFDGTVSRQKIETIDKIIFPCNLWKNYIFQFIKMVPVMGLKRLANDFAFYIFKLNIPSYKWDSYIMHKRYFLSLMLHFKHRHPWFFPLFDWLSITLAVRLFSTAESKRMDDLWNHELHCVWRLDKKGQCIFEQRCIFIV